MTDRVVTPLTGVVWTHAGLGRKTSVSSVSQDRMSKLGYYFLEFFYLPDLTSAICVSDALTYS